MSTEPCSTELALKNCDAAEEHRRQTRRAAAVDELLKLRQQTPKVLAEQVARVRLQGRP